MENLRDTIGSYLLHNVFWWYTVFNLQCISGSIIGHTYNNFIKQNIFILRILVEVLMLQQSWCGIYEFSLICGPFTEICTPIPYLLYIQTMGQFLMEK